MHIIEDALALETEGILSMPVAHVPIFPTG